MLGFVERFFFKNNMNRAFQGIWIPKEVWLSKELTLQEKVFLVEIKSLSNPQCYANNKYFADFFGLSRTRVSLIIKSLIDKGFIKSEIEYKKDSKQVEKRILTPLQKLNTPFNKSYIPPLIKVKHPPLEKLKDNNTINNTINNNNNSIAQVEKSTSTETNFKKFSNDAKSVYKEVYKLFPKKYQAKNNKEHIKHLKVISSCLKDYNPKQLIRIIKFARSDDFWKQNTLSIGGLRNKKNDVMKIDNINAKCFNAPEPIKKMKLE